MRVTVNPKQVNKHLKAQERANREANKPKEKPKAAKAPKIT